MPSMLGFGIAMLFFVLFLIALSIAAFIFWIYMIIDCAKRKFNDDSTKVIWILILIFLGILGAIIYYFAVKKK